MSNHTIISLFDALCEDCTDNMQTEKCAHCDKMLCRTCMQDHTDRLMGEAREILSKLDSTVRDLQLSDQPYEVQLQSVADECHSMRDKVLLDTSNDIQMLYEQYEQQRNASYDHQHAKLDRIDALQKSSITQIFKKGPDDRKSAKRWRDEINGITSKLQNVPMTLPDLIDLTSQLRTLTVEIETSCKICDGAEVVLSDVTVQLPEVISGTAIVTSREKLKTPARQDLMATRLVMDNIHADTLSYYRSIGKPTYILSGISPNCPIDGYLHAAYSGIDGTIYVNDFGGSAIIQINDQGQHLSSFWFDSNEESYGPCPRGIAVDASGQVAVTAQNCAKLFTNDGTCVKKFGGGKHGKTGQFCDAYGLSYGYKNKLYLADWSNRRIQTKDVSGPWHVHSVFTEGPKGVTVGPDGTVFAVTGGYSPELWCLRQDGSKQVIQIDMKGITRDNDFGFSQVVIDRDGFILLADRGSHHVFVLDMNGTIHCTIGEYGSLPGQFNSPAGIALTRDGKLVISEFRNRRIQIF